MGKKKVPKKKTKKKGLSQVVIKAILKRGTLRGKPLSARQIEFFTSQLE